MLEESHPMPMEGFFEMTTHVHLF
jgi:hypothetical protein